jgi:hypothetical protein
MIRPIGCGARNTPERQPEKRSSAGERHRITPPEFSHRTHHVADALAGECPRQALQAAGGLLDELSGSRLILALQFVARFANGLGKSIDTLGRSSLVLLHLFARGGSCLLHRRRRGFA